MAGSAPEPQDVPVPIRHMVMARTLLAHSDKIPFGSTITPARIEDVFELVRMARGISREQMLREPSYYSVINTNSPMQLDGAMAWGVIGFAERNQALCVTPFTLAGAMAPVTIAGALAQQNAEALAAITLSQIVRPGAPVIYGGFTSNVDMRSGAPAFGTPEYIKACLIGGQLARRYNMPYRSSNTNASNAAGRAGDLRRRDVDLGRPHGRHQHAAARRRLARGRPRRVLREVHHRRRDAADDGRVLHADDRRRRHARHRRDPRGRPWRPFLRRQHTIERYETAFYTPLLSDWRNFQQWEATGSVDATHRATRIWKQLLADYEEPKLDPAIAEEMDAYIDRRTREGGAPYV